MKNIHVLPTDKPSRLVYVENATNKYQLFNCPNNEYKSLNIYITSDEEIKEGDWVFNSYKVEFAPQVYEMPPHPIGEWWDKEELSTTKKIILTTDQDLIKDGVQSIDDDFLEWFVNNPSCEKVEIIEELNYFNIDELRDRSLKNLPHSYSEKIGYIIIIPKDYCDDCNNEVCCCIIKEEPKQETLEEFIFKVPFDYNIKPKEVMDMCMKEQENIILTWRLGYFIDMINSLPDDTEKNKILKSVFNNRDGELLLESYKKMKSHYEK